MQQYELLCVLPGTLADSDVAPHMDNVRSVIETKGGKVLSFEDMGKSRLAYPMKHIRYGYFRLCRFTADPARLPLIEQKLKLNKDLLRSFIVKQNATAIPRAVHFVTPLSSTEREYIAPAPMERAPVRAPVREPAAAVPSPATVAAEETIMIPLEDIGKRLDEILEQDIIKDL